MSRKIEINSGQSTPDIVSYIPPESEVGLNVTAAKILELEGALEALAPLATRGTVSGAEVMEVIDNLLDRYHALQQEFNVMRSDYES